MDAKDERAQNDFAALPLWAQDYIKRLRQEAARWRRKAQAGRLHSRGAPDRADGNTPPRLSSDRFSTD